MLVLTRGIGEKIRIGNGVVEVSNIRGNRVVFGFDFPDDTMIFRSELPDYKREALIDQLQTQQDEGLTSDGILVLSRIEGESFDIGGVITLTLIRINGSRASIGIDAPRHIPVLRDELPQEQAA